MVGEHLHPFLHGDLLPTMVAASGGDVVGRGEASRLRPRQYGDGDRVAHEAQPGSGLPNDEIAWQPRSRARSLGSFAVLRPCK